MRDTTVLEELSERMHENADELEEVTCEVAELLRDFESAIGIARTALEFRLGASVRAVCGSILDRIEKRHCKERGDLSPEDEKSALKWDFSGYMKGIDTAKIGDFIKTATEEKARTRETMKATKNTDANPGSFERQMDGLEARIGQLESRSLEKALSFLPAAGYSGLVKLLNLIIEQLESCGYECEGGPLELNTAFVALRKLAGLPGMRE